MKPWLLKLDSSSILLVVRNEEVSQVVAKFPLIQNYWTMIIKQEKVWAVYNLKVLNGQGRPEPVCDYTGPAGHSP